MQARTPNLLKKIPPVTACGARRGAASGAAAKKEAPGRAYARRGYEEVLSREKWSVEARARTGVQI